MRVLVVGGGGREHAIGWSLAKSPSVHSLTFTPGNAGMASLGECMPVRDGDIAAVASLAEYIAADLVVVGPEGPLVAGLADVLRDKRIPVFGPGRRGAMLEGSKIHAKRLMAAYGIPTAEAAAFERADEALAHIGRVGAPIVVKADGLAAGKGVTVCEDVETARAAVVEAMQEGRFGDAGRRVVLEECLRGEELSVLAFADGKTVVAMEGAQDFKRAYEGDRGPNTGGMGSYSPVPACSPAVQDAVYDRILEPIAAAVAAEGEPYVGVIYAGLMLTDDGPKVVEFNCRFGDPETQAVLPRLETPLADVMVACTEGRLAEVDLSWRPDACVTVVAASEGYPGSYATGARIDGLEEAAEVPGSIVFHAGTTMDRRGNVLTAGGRVLAVSGLGPSIPEARATAYEALSKISFAGMWSRPDIAARAG
ncbi:MAG: phosphoribosylamine--glycine ligase [Actinomycetota bacterium]